MQERSLAAASLRRTQLLSITSSVTRNSASEGTGSAYQNVALRFSDAYHGSFVFSDGISGTHGPGPYAYDNGIVFGGTLFPATSSYAFTLTTPGSIQIDWTAAFFPDPTTNGGVIFPLIFIVDGSTYRYCANGLYFVFAGYVPTGSWSESLAVGDHTLQVADFTLMNGGWPTINAYETTTLSFAIAGTIENAPTLSNAAPEPATFALVVMGLSGIAFSRRVRMR